MYTINTSIKSWAEDDRPREKLQNKGRSALSDAELLAIVIGSGTRKKSAVELAQDILKSCNNDLYQLGKMGQHELMRFSGIGEAKAISIIAVLELGRRRSITEVALPKKITQAKDAFEFSKHHFQDLDHEEFRIIGLSRSNRILGERLISKGGRTGTIVDGKMVFKELLDMKATSCILLHNHPSGKLEPSNSDIQITKKLVEFGKLIEIAVLDHLIISDVGYYSFSDEGRMY